jgi:trehalose utilization protein
VAPNHPITQGIGDYLELANTEMYGERFDIPEPDQLIFVSWFAGGEVFRSGCVFNRGNGRVFYFRPGHETYPIYHNPQVIKVIGNACRWLAPAQFIVDKCPMSPALEPIADTSKDFGKAGIQQASKL